MRQLLRVVMIISIAWACGTAIARGEPLKVLTINAWSGLDYNGTLKMGEYESRKAREARFSSLAAQARQLSPDVIFVQEANPVGKYTSRLASSLSMNEIHQVVNAGFKVGSLGIPFNLKEGVAILAKPGLSLKKIDTWQLYGSKGIHTDLLSIHFSEVVLALVGRIEVAGQEIILVNVHLVAAPRIPEEMNQFLDGVLSRGEMTEGGLKEGLDRWRRREERRMEEVKKLTQALESACSEVLCIVAGDFNAEPDSAEIRFFKERGAFTDTLGESGELSKGNGKAFTWDVDRNTNIAMSTRTRDARGKVREGFDYLAAVAGDRSKRLDYIFLGKGFTSEDVLQSGVVLTERVEGVQPSDHFGVFAEIDLIGPGRR